MAEESTPDPPQLDQPELLRETRRNRVTRVQVAAGTVVRKEPLGPDRDKRLRQEMAVLRRLSGVDGVVQLAPAQPFEGSIVLVDIGGSPVADQPAPLALDSLTRVASLLARAVEEMHGRGVAHCAINPSNVLVDAAGRPVLAGFGFATTFAEIRPEFGHPGWTGEALAYVAPEQTGRTGRPVDHRADLYALGAVLYELATGVPPFGAGDPLRSSHDYLTREPVPTAVARPEVPTGLSDVIMHLLEKEPDNRYQTAEGLAYDLALVSEGRTDTDWRIGTGDFPRRLVPPTRPVGREAQIAALDAAFTAALAGRSRGVIVSGPPGVGKTTLINELRSVASARDGWFVAGKFDQHRRDMEFDALWQAFHGLGELLLAAPEDEVAEVRTRLVDSIGPYAGQLAALHPAFAALLDVAPTPATGDPLMAEARLQVISVELLRIVASPKRPIVLVVDDLQWAGRVPMAFVDTMLGEQTIDGLLLVAAYREEDVNVTHPLRAMLNRWDLSGTGPEQIRLGNLSPASFNTLLADMLRLSEADAAELAHTITPATKGNPYDTVELLNSLRNEGVLTPSLHGWHWDRSGLRDSLHRAGVTDLLAQRANAMPTPSRTLLDEMACLGGRVELTLLQVATGRSAIDVEQRLGPALDDGLLVLESGVHETIRFRHDRVQETLLQHLGTTRQQALRLRLARRLRNAPDYVAAAAELYLPVMEMVRDRDERRDVSVLLRDAADQAKLLSNYALVERCLTAAVALVDPTDTAAMIDVQTGRMWALYSLGRLDEIEDLYRTVDQMCTTPLQRVEATLVQISSLTNRRQPAEAVRLCLKRLRQLGHDVPGPENVDAETERGLDRVFQWVDQDEPPRPDMTDPTLVAAAELITHALPAAYTSERELGMMGWLVVESFRIWAEHGPAQALVGPMGFISFVSVARRGDYRVGHRALKRILAVCDARGYEPDASQARVMYVLGAGPWFDPLEDNLRMAETARERLIHGGDLQFAGYSYLPSMQELFDCASTLDSYLTEIEAGLAFAQRTGNGLVTGQLEAFRRLVGVLRQHGGQAVDLLAAPSMDTATSTVVGAELLAGSLGTVLLGDAAMLAQQVGAMAQVVSEFHGDYATATVRVLRALVLAAEIRSASSAAVREGLLNELDVIVDWLAARAIDAPVNFMHLLRLVEAERAWAVGDFRAAGYAFDVAQREAAARQRPWHRALIFERTARLYLSQNMESTADAFLSAARREYLAWGATAKVDQMDWAYPALRSGDAVPTLAPEQQPDAAVSRAPPTSSVDLMGILAASQALSSATSIDSLRAQVVEVLGAMTGATLVHLLVRNPDEQAWLLPTPDSGAMVTVDEAARRGLLPISVVRYADRTLKPLVIPDATKDDRFTRDPYMTSLDCCSMLVLPVLSRGAPRALLLLENRLIRSAFSTERLDTVTLIAGQLAVSLDNARVYASLERKVAERTTELAAANRQLEKLSITDALTGVANRRRLEDVLTAEWQIAQRTRNPMSLAMIDIDHFKLYNDHYGHLAGDACLQRIATELHRCIRTADLIARYGGEEFLIVMPDVDIDAACRAAERLRHAVAALDEPHHRAPDRIVTVSIGTATLIPTADNAPPDLIEAADIQLYKAKHAGRNRVSSTVS